VEIGKKKTQQMMWKEYKKSKQNAKRVISSAKEINRRNVQVI